MGCSLLVFQGDFSSQSLDKVSVEVEDALNCYKIELEVIEIGALYSYDLENRPLYVREWAALRRTFLYGGYS